MMEDDKSQYDQRKRVEKKKTNNQVYKLQIITAIADKLISTYLLQNY